MNVNLEINPDEALALIEVLEHDILHRELSARVILELERARHRWAREQKEALELNTSIGTDIESMRDHLRANPAYITKKEFGDWLRANRDDIMRWNRVRLEE